MRGVEWMWWAMDDDILVVDDDMLMRPDLALNLERAGHRMNPGNAEQALALIQECPPDVIFLTARRSRLDQILRGTVSDRVDRRLRELAQTLDRFDKDEEDKQKTPSK